MKNLDFVQSAINNVAKDLDAEQFDQLIRSYDLEFEYMATDKNNKNKDLFEVFLLDFDMSICYVDGKFIP